ncbi:hypothetical protein JW979_00820 [bacterium]|nr:hypothetical protein [candidate division CSSED10-310 bacterium]
MYVENLIPGSDPIPVAWGWLKFFLLLTFIFHLLFMNTMLGTAFIALANSFKKSKTALSVTKKVSSKLPYVIAFTINTGVAPLLFLQVLYGSFIYVSSVLMAVYWLSILLLLLLGYYSAYMYDFGFNRLGSWRMLFIAITVINLMIIGFFFTNNATLMLHPDQWSRYFDRPFGTLLNLTDPTLWPRYLHFMVASFAVGGLFIAIIGTLQRNKGLEKADREITLGMKWFSHATLLQIFIGLWFFITVPKNIMLLFMGQNILYTSMFIIGIGLSFLTVIMGYRKKVLASTVSMLLTIVLMTLTRDFLRTAYLNEHFHISKLPVIPQYSPMIVFIVSLVAGLAMVVLMLRWAHQSIKKVNS